jgi:hypothetical protein
MGFLRDLKIRCVKIAIFNPLESLSRSDSLDSPDSLDSLDLLDLLPPQPCCVRFAL